MQPQVSSSSSISDRYRSEAYRGFDDRRRKNVLGQEGTGRDDSTKSVELCFFFYNRKNLCLRGSAEHRQLKFFQLRHDAVLVGGVQKSCYIYTEHGSKNRSGGLGQLNLPNKVIHHLEVPEASEKDYVGILDLYFSRVPKEAIEKDNFYVRPLTAIQDGKPWFSSVPLG